MKNQTKALLYNSLALFFGIIALLTSWLWAYYVNLFIAFPSLIAAFFLCKSANKAMPGNLFSKVNYVLIASAIAVAFVMLIVLLLNN
jgi:hypothetical protein